MNRVWLTGHVCGQITYHCTAGGSDLTRFCLSTRSADRADTLHHCEAWGPAALDLHTHLRSGDTLCLIASLTYRGRGRDREYRRVPRLTVRAYTYLGQLKVLGGYRATMLPPRRPSDPGSCAASECVRTG